MALSKTSILLGENDQPYFENTIVSVSALVTEDYV